MMTTSIALAAAHAGHAGDHGWLAGAAQPLLSWDHLAAAVFVVLLVAIGLAALGAGQPRREESRER
jgi:hydrogenase/urease accessory protein HupE